LNGPPRWKPRKASDCPPAALKVAATGVFFFIVTKDFFWFASMSNFLAISFRYPAAFIFCFFKVIIVIIDVRKFDLCQPQMPSQSMHM
jgi:hypothetical protein